MNELTLELYKQEERRLAVHEARLGLRVHAAITAVVIVALAVVNAFIASEFPWSVFPAAGMSIGVFAHWYFGVQRGDEFVRRHQDDIEREARRLVA